MPRRELTLERHVHAGRAGDIARATTAGAVRRGLRNRRDHFGVRGHAEVVVRAPDRDVLRRAICVTQRRLGRSSDTLELRKGAIATLGLEPIKGVVNEASVIHVLHSTPPC